MLGLILAAMSVSQPPASPSVELADAYGFGMPIEVVSANWRTAETHRWTMGAKLVEELPRWQFEQWRDHQEARRACWRWLEYALDDGLPDATRRYALDQLRDLIGPDDYFDRRMPLPLPSYRR
jgi:hypothetical protein